MKNTARNGASDFYNPFASSPSRPPATNKPATNKQAIGAPPPLQLVSSRRVVASPSPTGMVEEGRLLKVGGGAAVWVASSTPVQSAPEPLRAGATPEPSNDYWSQPATPTPPAVTTPAPVAKTGGGGGGGGDGPRDGGEPMKARTSYDERIFDQDDLTGLLIGVALLLLLGWMWLQGRGGQPAEQEAAVQPQMAASEPEAPAPDPFGRGPVDLRPTSPIPDPVEDPVDEALEIHPTSSDVIEAPRLPETDVSGGPPTQLASAVSAAEIPFMTQAYFCTASSSLTPAGRVQLDRQIAQWKASGAAKEFVVTGFADTRGPTAFNVQLGALRADYVADVLRAEGFTVIEAVGVGELDDIDDEQNCPNQRRVDIALKGAVLSSPTRACQPPRDVQPLACS